MGHEEWKYAAQKLCEINCRLRFRFAVLQLTATFYQLFLSNKKFLYDFLIAFLNRKYVSPFYIQIRDEMKIFFALIFYTTTTQFSIISTLIHFYYLLIVQFKLQSIILISFYIQKLWKLILVFISSFFFLD